MKHEGLLLLPTGLWLIFGPILVCMWVAAVNYSNNLVYAILYLIAALSFISVFHTWRNVSALRVEHIRIQAAFVGEEVRVEIFLRNSTKHAIYSLFFARSEGTGLSRTVTNLLTPDGRGVRLAPGDSCSVEAVLAKQIRVSKWGTFGNVPAVVDPKKKRSRFSPLTIDFVAKLDPFKIVLAPGSGEQRGIYRFESLQVKTAYPFGLIWASYRVPVDVEYYVYPQPKGATMWPHLTPGGEHGSPTSQRSGDDFAGVRAYMPGESLRHVDWKAFARGRPLSIKQFSGGAGYELWLDAESMDHLPLETRLSQLALWIVNAEKEEIPYALKLGRTTLPLGMGAAHSRRALEALAVAGVGTT